ncbi:MarR family transcriptional regulator [Salinimonas sp. HHU 13199]|uniref:MarR family transcriptional regulator n=1 Tax=Salinimonas profundi TaxID=2729140 RepID=A0ABR8LMM0_9ALTE|nr:helix-turn-helix domain-containing protein [Salinimonas profundi]MBD3587433.1 MarR family transcriptional regulator [Salinimonas profundi]
MNYIERAIETSMSYICIANPSDPGTLGSLREDAVIAIVGAFGLSSKTVIQRHLGLTREGVNKLVNRMKKKGLLAVHPSFANTDRGFILLTSQGIRKAEFLLNRELHLRSDFSRVNERNLIHDLSVQIVVLDLAKAQKINGFATERDLAVQLKLRGNDPRLVDALVVDADTHCNVAIEMETSNAKNKSNGDIRKKIISKYLEELESNDGLYEFVYMYSHRQRYLTQIEKAHARLFAAHKSSFSADQQQLIASRIKYKPADCNTIYELMFNSKRQLGDDKLELVRKDTYLHHLEEIEKLVRSSGDRVAEIRREGFIEAGKVLGIID